MTAHALPLLMGVEAHALESVPDAVLGDPIEPPVVSYELPPALSGAQAPRVGVYKGHRETMPAGWTRWMLDQHALRYDTLHDVRLRAGALNDDYDVLLFQSQSAESIVDGHPPGSLPERYTGGLGPAGSAAVRQFVENGGRLVVVEEAAEFAVQLFGLNVTNPVAGLPSTDFYVPGSLLRVELAPDRLTSSYDGSTPVWYWRSSRAFEVGDDRVEVLGRYARELVVAGWVLGPERLAGRAAMLRARIGQGEVILFGFQPNYRGQSIVTWPLLFDVLAG